MEQNFIPRVFSVDEKKVTECFHAWETLIDAASSFLGELQEFFEADNGNFDVFRQFGDSDLPDNEFIASLFIAKYPENASHFKYLEMVKAGMVEYSPYILEERGDYMRAKNDVKFYSFRYNILDCVKDGLFDVPDNLQELIREHYTIKTMNSQENEIVSIIESIKDNANLLHEKGYVKSTMGVLGLFQGVSKFFVINLKNKQKPIELSPLLFKRIHLMSEENDE